MTSSRLLVALFACGLIAGALGLPATFSVCPERAALATNVAIDVSDCNSTLACPLYRGTRHDFTVSFTPTEDSNQELERVVIAKFPGRRSIEIPYGPPVPASNSTTRDSDGQKVTDIGIVTDDPYTHNEIFPVMKNAPPSSLRVRYIIREKVDGLSRRQSEWKRHPGKIFACVELPVKII